MDTNAVIALLRGNSRVVELTRDAEWLGISIISQLEYLSFPGLTENDRNLFLALLPRIEVVDLSSQEKDLIRKAIEIRRSLKVKLPDAITAATCLARSAALITADARLASISSLSVLTF